MAWPQTFLLPHLPQTTEFLCAGPNVNKQTPSLFVSVGGKANYGYKIRAFRAVGCDLVF